MSTGWRRLIIFLVVLAVVLVAVDRIGARVVAGQIATRAQRTERLAQRPAVSIDGFPFLTQVVAGRYHDVKVTVRGFQPSNGPRVDEVKADLQGVHVALGDAIRGSVRQVPVDRVAARTHLTFADLNAYLATQNTPARLSRNGTKLLVGGTVTLAGISRSATADVALGVAGDVVTVTPTAVAGVGALLPAAVRQTLVGLLTVRIPVEGLPFNIHLQSAEVDGDGLTFTAGGEGVVLTNSQLSGQ
jgi:LmeA-like phospholipid-binding